MESLRKYSLVCWSVWCMFNTLNFLNLIVYFSIAKHAIYRSFFHQIFDLLWFWFGLVWLWFNQTSESLMSSLGTSMSISMRNRMDWMIASNNCLGLWENKIWSVWMFGNCKVNFSVDSFVLFEFDWICWLTLSPISDWN